MNHTKQHSQSLVIHDHIQLNNGYQQLQSLPHSYRQRLPRQFKTTLISVAVALVLSHSPQARAATITVNTTNPAINTDTQCSLIEAINNANDDVATHADCPAGSGADTIILSANTYSLLVADNQVLDDTNGLPQITSTISIQGNGAIIQGAGREYFRLFYIRNTGDLTLDKTTVSGGSLQRAGHGGGLYNYGNLTLTNSTVSGNYVNDIGGGLFNGGTATLINSTISGNTAYLGGGGLFNSGAATLTLINSTISGNTSSGSGGGLDNQGIVTLTNSTISSNITSSRYGLSGGGGLYNSGTATLTNSTVSNNSASGFGDLEEFGGTEGGGFFNGGTTTITNSTISGNYAKSGGGFFNGGTITITNSTISGNYANYGGGLFNSGGRGGSATLVHSLISGNSATNSANEIFGIISANDYNIFGHSTQSNTRAFDGFSPGSTDITATSDGTTPTALTNILNTTLADNGGSTQTHALVAGSPAVDAVPAASCATTQDQRGETRPVDGGTGVSNCDSGAFELKECAASYTLLNNQWRQISLPCTPPVANNTAGDIFGDDGLGDYGTDWILWAYDSATNSYVNPGLGDTLLQGVGYWIIQHSDSAKSLDMPADSTPTPTTNPTACLTGAVGCFEIPLATQTSTVQWNLIGYPFATVRSLGDARVTTAATTCDNSSGCTLDEAEANQFVNNKVWIYDDGVYTSINTSTNLNPWMGYWFSTLIAAETAEPVKLLIPKN